MTTIARDGVDEARSELEIFVSEYTGDPQRFDRLWVMTRVHAVSGGGVKAADYFGKRLARIKVGDSQGEDQQRGAYDWWPLTINGKRVGELRDDANGLTVHV